MAVTVLALLFLAGIGAVAVVGYRLMFRRNVLHDTEQLEKCSICRQKFERDELVLRQVGDTRLLFFCRNCIVGLYSELGIRN